MTASLVLLGAAGTVVDALSAKHGPDDVLAPEVPESAVDEETCLAFAALPGYGTN